MLLSCPACLSSESRRIFKNEVFDLFKCADCGLVFIKTDLQESYEESYFSDRKKYYQNYKHNYNEKVFPIPGYKRIINSIKRLGFCGKLLEVGCSKGIFLDLARKEGFDVTGVDVSTYATEYAREHFNLNVICGNFLNIDFPDDSFDDAVVLDLIEHINEPEVLLKRIFKSLKRNSLLVLVTPNEESLLNKISYAIYRLSLGVIKFPVRSNHAPEHRFYFSVKSIGHLLHKSGFKIINYDYHDIDPALMDYGLFATLAAKVIFFLARLLHKQHKMTIFAVKSNENSNS
jgi:2-polyprenyl-3-methyl-5-hydroxy-6-metoxy-1,4-benzoquinol methylase